MAIVDLLGMAGSMFDDLWLSYSLFSEFWRGKDHRPVCPARRFDEEVVVWEASKVVTLNRQGCGHATRKEQASLSLASL